MRKKFSVVNISNIMKNAMYIHLEASLIMPFIVFKAANDGWGLPLWGYFMRRKRLS